MINVNTKILASPLTGVQRYLNEILARIGDEMTAIAPTRPLSGISGHVWEQTSLAARVGKNVLWSPSNTGPLAVRNQVVTIHDVAALDHPEWLSKNFAAWYRILTPRLVHRVRRIITVSEFTKQRLISNTSVNPEKITVVPNGVDARFCPRSPSEIESMVTLVGLPSKRYVLTVGSIEPRKNLKRLLEAWRLIHAQIDPDIWLVIAGSKGKSTIFASETSTNSLPPRVFLTGYVDEPTLPILYAGSMLFAYISLYEGFGLPPLESLASGVPVLVSNSTVFPEVIGNAGAYADPFDIVSIGGNIISLLKNEDLRHSNSMAGLEYVKKFSWDRTADQTLQILVN
jgi:glycosyltransferase involved in cell wall biosynthesis